MRLDLIHSSSHQLLSETFLIFGLRHLFSQFGISPTSSRRSMRTWIFSSATRGSGFLWTGWTSRISSVVRYRQLQLSSSMFFISALYFSAMRSNLTVDAFLLVSLCNDNSDQSDVTPSICWRWRLLLIRQPTLK